MRSLINKVSLHHRTAAVGKALSRSSGPTSLLQLCSPKLLFWLLLSFSKVAVFLLRTSACLGIACILEGKIQIRFLQTLLHHLLISLFSYKRSSLKVTIMTSLEINFLERVQYKHWNTQTGARRHKLHIRMCWEKSQYFKQDYFKMNSAWGCLHHTRLWFWSSVFMDFFIACLSLEILQRNLVETEF